MSPLRRKSPIISAMLRRFSRRRIDMDTSTVHGTWWITGSELPDLRWMLADRRFGMGFFRLW